MYVDNQHGDLRNSERVVLVVDDEPLVRTMAARMLHHLGCNVLTADSGAAAISICEQISRREYPQVSALSMAILDMTMPVMDGVETGRRIKNLLPMAPVVISSGYQSDSVRKKCNPGDVEAFLQKPFSVADLDELLTKVVN